MAFDRCARDPPGRCAVTGVAKLSEAVHKRSGGDPKFRPLFATTATGKACQGHEELMFPDATEYAMQELAKALCARCPFRELCLEWALTTREPFGVWGGMTPEERRAPTPGRKWRAARKRK
jgi:WhiB family redox-sensing transcriptional regulator